MHEHVCPRKEIAFARRGLQGQLEQLSDLADAGSVEKDGGRPPCVMQLQPGCSSGVRDFSPI